MLSGYYRKGCPDVAEIWSSKKLDPAGGGIDDIRRLLWWRCARASARFFFACGLPAPCPAPPSEICRQGCGQAGRWSFFLSSNRPLAVHNGRGSLFFCFSIIPALAIMTRGELLCSRQLRCRPLSTCRGAAFVKTSKKNIARRGRLAAVWCCISQIGRRYIMWKYYLALVAAFWLFFNTFFRSPW